MNTRRMTAFTDPKCKDCEAKDATIADLQRQVKTAELLMGVKSTGDE